MEPIFIENLYCDPIFEAIQDIFGHFTVRLTFANMIDYYYKENDIVGIKVIQRPHYGSGKEQDTIGSMLGHTGFFSYTTLLGQGLSVLHQDTRVRDLFGFFFLEASLRLSLETSGYKYIDLPYGPLLGVGSQELKLGNLIGRKTSRKTEFHKLSEALANRFSSLYDNFYQKRSDEFIRFKESQTNLFKFLKVKLTNKLNDIFKLKRVKDVAKERGVSIEEWRAYVLSKALRYLRLGVFHHQVDSPTSIRGQVDSFLINKDSTFEIVFYGINSPDPAAADLSLIISKEELLDVEFISWPSLFDFYYESGSRTIAIARKRNMIMNSLGEKVQEMREIIQAAGSKAYIIPFVDKGEIGFQYSYEKEWWYPADDYFEIDLSDPNSELILKHIAVAMLSSDCGFILAKSLPDGPSKVYGGNNYIRIKEMICAFNREGFFKRSELYSLADNNEFQLIVESEFDLDYVFDDEGWLRRWGFELSFSGVLYRGDFYWYKELVRSSDIYMSLRVLLQKDDTF